jgi:hypothetical protein
MAAEAWQRSFDRGWGNEGLSQFLIGHRRSTAWRRLAESQQQKGTSITKEPIGYSAR